MEVKLSVLDQIANDIIKMLKKRKMWNENIGIIYNGYHLTVGKAEEDDREIRGDMYIWFDGPVLRAINDGSGSNTKNVYTDLVSITGKYGYYPEFWDYSSMNIYKI